MNDGKKKRRNEAKHNEACKEYKQKMNDLKNRFYINLMTVNQLLKQKVIELYCDLFFPSPFR